MKREDLTADEFRRHIDYDPETGVFRVGEPTNRARKKGDLMGSSYGNGYARISLWGHEFLAHRVAWIIVNGKWPEGHIDHINGVRTDNRICNLRDVPRFINQENQGRANSRNISGFLGVTTLRDKWLARIHVRGRLVRLGLFNSPEEASKAYLSAKAKLHAGYVHGRA